MAVCIQDDASVFFLASGSVRFQSKESCALLTAERKITPLKEREVSVKAIDETQLINALMEKTSC